MYSLYFIICTQKSKKVSNKSVDLNEISIYTFTKLWIVSP